MALVVFPLFPCQPQLLLPLVHGAHRTLETARSLVEIGLGQRHNVVDLLWCPLPMCVSPASTSCLTYRTEARQHEAAARAAASHSGFTMQRKGWALIYCGEKPTSKFHVDR